jgi:peroxiredoxin
MQNAGALKAKGIEAIACISVNDAFVMGAWAKDQATGDTIDMLGDGSGELAKAMDVELDLGSKGLGLRGKRFALVAEDGVVMHLALQDGGELTTSSAEETLKAL